MKFLIVDDHPLVREGLQHVLQHAYDGSLVLEAGSFAHCRDLLCQHPDLDLVLLDIGLPDQDGIESLREIRAQWPSIPVMMISAHDDHSIIQESLDAGAMGFISKSSNNQVISSAIRLVLSGGIYITPRLLERDTTDDTMGHRVTSTSDTSGTDTAIDPSELGITIRQAQVLSLLMQGKPNKVICRELNLAAGTVKVHVSAILRALGATSRAEAISIASRLGFKFD